MENWFLPNVGSYHIYDVLNAESNPLELYLYFYAGYPWVILSKAPCLSYSMIIQKYTASYFITLETFWRIEIFWSPSFYTITLIKLLSWPSLPVTHYMQFSRILKVRLTILGLLSFSIFKRVGKTAFIEASNYGLFLLTWIL